jgi:F-type H+-transporting ATPase subunit b
VKIDWLTFAAQIVNFLILVWLLRKFLYGPILNAMQKRSDRIHSQIQEARQRKQEAEQEAESYRSKKQDLENQEEDLLQQARDKAEQERKRLTEEARSQVDEQKEKWQEALRREKDSFLNELSRKSGEQLYEAVSSALKALADESLEKRLVENCIGRLKNLDEEEASQIKEKLTEDKNEILVRTSWPLEDKEKDRIEKELQEVLLKDASIQFEVSESITAGIEIAAGGRKIGWTLNEYLERIESNFRKELQQLEQEKESGSKQEDKDKDENQQKQEEN